MCRDFLDVILTLLYAVDITVGVIVHMCYKKEASCTCVGGFPVANT